MSDTTHDPTDANDPENEPCAWIGNELLPESEIIQSFRDPLCDEEFCEDYDEPHDEGDE